MRKRILSFALTLCMIAGLVTAFPIIASAEASGTWGNNLTWTLDDEGTLTISGTGDMRFWTPYPWEKYDSAIEKVVIGDGVTSITSYAFCNCTNLTSIEIQDGVTSIGSGAFFDTGYYNDASNWEDDVLYIGNYIIEAKDTSLGSYNIKECTYCIADQAFRICESLTSIEIPNSVRSIGSDAFCGCSSLASVAIPDSVTSIGSHAFDGCRSLTSVAIPDSVTSIGDRAFYGCYSLASVAIPNGVTSIEDVAFGGCYSLTSIEIPDSVTSIGVGAFDSCISLISIAIPNSVTSIGDGAFDSCSSLISIAIPNSVTSIGRSTFEDCTALTSIAIPRSITFIGNNAFYKCKSLTEVYYSGTYEEWEAISISDGNNYLTRAMIHYKMPVVAIVLYNAPVSMEIGDELTLNAEAMPEDATDKAITWTSSDESVAVVSNSGTITALSEGTAVITAATANGTTAEAEITVVRPARVINREYITIDKTTNTKALVWQSAAGYIWKYAVKWFDKKPITYTLKCEGFEDKKGTFNLGGLEADSFDFDVILSTTKTGVTLIVE